MVLRGKNTRSTQALCWPNPCQSAYDRYIGHVTYMPGPASGVEKQCRRGSTVLDQMVYVKLDTKRHRILFTKEGRLIWHEKRNWLNRH